MKQIEIVHFFVYIPFNYDESTDYIQVHYEEKMKEKFLS